MSRFCGVATQRDYPRRRSVRNKELIIYFVKPYNGPYDRNPNRAEGKENPKKPNNTGAVGWVATVTVSVDKIEGLNGEGGVMKRRISLSAPSSQLHLSPQVPEHTDTEQIDSTLSPAATSP